MELEWLLSPLAPRLVAARYVWSKCYRTTGGTNGRSPRRQTGFVQRASVSATLWVVIGRIAGVLGTALVAFLLPRFLPPDECGRFLLTQNLICLGSLIGVAGLPLAMVKLLAEGHALRNRRWMHTALFGGLRILVVTSSTVALVATTWLAMWGGRWLKLDVHLALLVAFAATLLLLAWQWVFVEAIRGLGELAGPACLQGDNQVARWQPWSSRASGGGRKPLESHG